MNASMVKKIVNSRTTSALMRTKLKKFSRSRFAGLRLKSNRNRNSAPHSSRIIPDQYGLSLVWVFGDHTMMVIPTNVSTAPIATLSSINSRLSRMWRRLRELPLGNRWW
uniref:(northern house mosquito) hypothetical protein n=1 Tax=Culex pipiens TaxID=7175 RepID=A0A8D8DAB3_CULPI